MLRADLAGRAPWLEFDPTIKCGELSHISRYGEGIPALEHGQVVASNPDAPTLYGKARPLDADSPSLRVCERYAKLIELPTEGTGRDVGSDSDPDPPQSTITPDGDIEAEKSYRQASDGDDCR